MAKEICERCGKVFEAGPNSYYCQKCRSAILSAAAKKRNLHELGLAARRKRITGRTTENE